MIKNLTGIRGIAAIWVLLFHYREFIFASTIFPDFLKPLIEAGHYGVDLFFFLSGFILGHVYIVEYSSVRGIGWTQIRKYFVKRFARVYPVYLLTTVVAILLYSVAILIGHTFQTSSADNLNFLVVLKNVLGIQILDNTPSLNYPAWSVSAELLAYLVFPVLMKVIFLREFGVKRRSVVVFLMSFLLFIYSTSAETILNKQIFQVLSEFTMGLCALILIRDFCPTKFLVLAIRRFLVLLLPVVLLQGFDHRFLEVLVPLLLLLCIVANYFQNFPNSGLGRSEFLVLGVWSYSLYLTHGIIQQILSGFRFPYASKSSCLNAVEIFSIVIFSILISRIVTHYIEIPARNFILKKSYLIGGYGNSD